MPEHGRSRLAPLEQEDLCRLLNVRILLAARCRCSYCAAILEGAERDTVLKGRLDEAEFACKKVLLSLTDDFDPSVDLAQSFSNEQLKALTDGKYDWILTHPCERLDSAEVEYWLRRSAMYKR